jgi:LysM repeat protein
MFDSTLDTEHVFGHCDDMPRARIRRRRGTVVLCGVVVLLGLPAVSRAVADRPADRPATTYVVRPGDTLWSIAVGSAPGSDPREVVDAIARANHVDAGQLIPGQELQLPASR